MNVCLINIKYCYNNQQKLNFISTIKKFYQNLSIQDKFQLEVCFEFNS